MNARQLVIFLITAALSAVLVKKLWEALHSHTASVPPNEDRSPVVSYVEAALQEHAGEAAPLVQAFESVLEMETRHGQPAPTA